MLFIAAIATSCYREVDCTQVTAYCTIGGETQKCVVTDGCNAEILSDSLSKAGISCNCTYVIQ